MPLLPGGSGLGVSTMCIQPFFFSVKLIVSPSLGSCRMPINRLSGLASFAGDRGLSESTVQDARARQRKTPTTGRSSFFMAGANNYLFQSQEWADFLQLMLVLVKATGDDRGDVLFLDPAEVMVAGLDAKVIVMAVLDGDELALGDSADAVRAGEGREAERGLLGGDDDSLNACVEAQGGEFREPHQHRQRNGHEDDGTKRTA